MQAHGICIQKGVGFLSPGMAEPVGPRSCWGRCHGSPRPVDLQEQAGIYDRGNAGGRLRHCQRGRSWKRVGGNELQKAESVAIDPIDHKILYVGTWRLGYKSSDFGTTWIRVDNGMPLDSDVFSIAIDYRNPSIVYSSACSAYIVRQIWHGIGQGSGFSPIDLRFARRLFISIR